MLWLTGILNFLANFWDSLTGDWEVLREPQVSAVDLTRTLEEGSIPSFSFYFMLALATIIATLGLISNNAATIIGAMIIAPLMNPIVTLSYAIVVGELQLLKRSVATLVSGIILTLSLAFVTTTLVGSRVAGSEIVARSNPNLLDLGVAMAAGAAAAFAYTRSRIGNSLAGVAIAVALVPPLSVVGIGLSLGQEVAFDINVADVPLVEGSLSTGALLLFVTNLAGIVLIAGLVFLFQAYGDPKKALLGLILSMAIVFLLTGPLGFSLDNLLLRNKIIHHLQVLSYEHPEWEAAGTYLADFSVRGQKEQVHVNLEVIAPGGLFSEDEAKLIQDFLSKELKKPVKLRMHVNPISILEIKDSPDD